MPEHGFNAPIPEIPQMRDQDMDKDLARTFQQWQQQEREEQSRKATAEASMINVAEILQKLDEKLDSEREQRKLSDDVNMKYTIRWNCVNLAVGITGIAVGVAGVIVAIFK